MNVNDIYEKWFSLTEQKVSGRVALCYVSAELCDVWFNRRRSLMPGPAINLLEYLSHRVTTENSAVSSWENKSERQATFWNYYKNTFDLPGAWKGFWGQANLPR